MILITALIFIGMLLMLVLVHEWGHFAAAKKMGCGVEEFGFGFPPRVWGKKWRGTLYSLNLLPIGGFVKIEGEDMADEHPGPQNFASKSAGARIFILAAGVVMNLVLAVVLLGLQAGIGAPTVVTEGNGAALTDHKTYILDVSPDSPAAEAGLKEFDRVAAMSGIENPSIADIQRLAVERAGEDVSFEIDRQGEHLTLAISPRAQFPEDDGAFGVSLAATGLQRTPWYLAPWEGVKRTGQMTVAIVSQFAILLEHLVTQGTAGSALTGPIGIAVYTNEAAQMGFSYLLEFAALISINLAIINILPLPALDGGRILFVILEKILGRRVPGKVESFVHTAGFVLLIGLMVFVTFKDAQRYF